MCWYTNGTQKQFSERFLRSFLSTGIHYITTKKPIKSFDLNGFLWYQFSLVEETGLEPTASSSRTKRSTKLSYTSKYRADNFLNCQPVTGRGRRIRTLGTRFWSYGFRIEPRFRSFCFMLFCVDKIAIYSHFPKLFHELHVVSFTFISFHFD